jgi:osmoprotectant transport system permease protein
MGFLGDVFDFLTSSDQWHGNESIPRLIGQHLQLTIVSVLVAALIALPIGIVLGHLRTGGTVAVNIANIGRALPAFALLILAVQWVGIGDPTGVLTPVQSVPAFIAMFALALPPMLANAYVGMASVDDEIREAARGMGMNGREMIWHVELPNAVPLVMAGVRTATVAVVATATLAAYVDSGGLGRYIVDGFAVNDNPKVFAGGLLVALLAIVLELLLALVQRAVTSPGIRSEGKIKVRELATDRIAPGGAPAL